jgi:GNAT superfamily N-acetyltransferase
VIERIRAFLLEASARTCDELRPTRHGTALLTPSLPYVWQLNALRVEDPRAGAQELIDDLEGAFAGSGHRKLVVEDEEHGMRLAPPLRRQGWNVVRLLVMVRSRAPERPAVPGLAVEADRASGAAALAAFRREQPFGWQDGAVQQLAAMDDRYSDAVAARDFVAPPNDPASACRLYSDERTAQVDEVGTLEAHRGRGLASATVMAAADAAAAAGHDLTFLLTDADDWPKELYRRVGFEPVGVFYEFLKLTLDSPSS